MQKLQIKFFLNLKSKKFQILLILIIINFINIRKKLIFLEIYKKNCNYKYIIIISINLNLFNYMQASNILSY